MRTLAVDFDGVIHTYERGWADGTIYGDVIPGAKAALLALMDMYAVYIHTTRDAWDVASWIAVRLAIETITDVPDSGFWDQTGILLVTDRKLPAIAYIDDRAVRFENWADTLAFLSAQAPAER